MQSLTPEVHGLFDSLCSEATASCGMVKILTYDFWLMGIYCELHCTIVYVRTLNFQGTKPETPGVRYKPTANHKHKLTHFGSFNQRI